MNAAVVFAFAAVLAVANAGLLAAPVAVSYSSGIVRGVPLVHAAAPVAYAAAPVAYAHPAAYAPALHHAPLALSAGIPHIRVARGIAAHAGLLAAGPLTYASPAIAHHAPLAYAAGPVAYAAPAHVAYAAPAVVKTAAVAPVAVSYNSGIIRGIPTTVYAASPVVKTIGAPVLL